VDISINGGKAMKIAELEATARALVAKGKGILAADESHPTVKKRFDTIGLESTEETRRQYRELFFTTRGMQEFISGVILFEETMRQSAQDGTLFPALLVAKGVLPGIKVDQGKSPIPGSPNESITNGLDGLRERLAEYRRLGARFTKWRAVIAIGTGMPTRYGIDANAQALARYAALSQEAGLTPIVEPEVLMDGDHDIMQCGTVSEVVLQSVFAELAAAGVAMEGMLLKPSMVLSGKACPRQAGVEEVAAATLKVMRRAVPAAVPGIVFLSGGQSAVVATEHLNAMNALGPHPWELSFSFARALQAPALAMWKGMETNFGAAQRVFLHRARCNSAARFGKYTKQLEQEVPKAA
jgi:fructose-bisphosphate aldolase class I